MSNFHPVLILIFLTSSPSIAMADLFGSESYEDCILENMKGIESDRAVRAVQSACLAKTAPKPRSKPEYDNTCYFLFDPKTNKFSQISEADYENLKKGHNRTFLPRNGVTRQELKVTEDLLIEADREEATNARAIADLLSNLLKHVFFPAVVPEDYIKTQADRVPFCSR